MRDLHDLLIAGRMLGGNGGSPAPEPTLITKSITANGVYSAEDDNADGYSAVSVEVPEKVLTTKTITENGTYAASSDGVDGYSSVTVNVPTPPAGNLFDPANAMIGYELDTTTGEPKPNSGGFVSDYIDVSNFSKIWICRAGTWRFCFFYSADKTKLSSWSDDYSGLINVPTNAKFFRMNDQVAHINVDGVFGAVLKEAIT
jgi:hypothetical protein